MTKKQNHLHEVGDIVSYTPISKHEMVIAVDKDNNIQTVFLNGHYPWFVNTYEHNDVDFIRKSTNKEKLMVSEWLIKYGK